MSTSYVIHHGDVLGQLRLMPAESVHCVVSSPPYWRLRDYGDPAQIGLEATPELYVAKIAEVFAEVRRVLRTDGTCWINIADTYAGSWGAQARGGCPSGSSTLLGNGHIGGGPKLASLEAVHFDAYPQQTHTGSWVAKHPTLKPKDMCLIPERLAIALQSDGWWIRSNVVWNKRNPMPSSTLDRPTVSHEYIRLLTKSRQYYYNADAIREPYATTDEHRSRAPWVNGWAMDSGDHSAIAHNQPSSHKGSKFNSGKTAKPNTDNGPRHDHPKGRNTRSVWTFASMPVSDAHFATYPLELPETCILAGCPEGGIVLDPFCGSGTTGLAAIKNGRGFVGIELNADYIRIARARLERHYPLFAAEVSA